MTVKEIPVNIRCLEYRQRMIQAFHNADTDELMAVCVLPTEKEFEHLEWLLKNHYKKASCADAVSRQAVIEITAETGALETQARVKALPPVDSQPKLGRWIRVDKDKLRCSECEVIHLIAQYPNGKIDWCPNCGAKMQEVEE